jgi:zinc protease
MKSLAVSIIVLAMTLPIAGQSAKKVFPHNFFIDDLPNGLRLITVPTDYPNIVALYIVVNAGSRNEIEPGKSGFAHLFEHLMFRGTEKYPQEKYNEILKAAGADQNAYTTDDRTVYHTVFSKEDLDRIMSLEADRFQHLKVSEELFKTETRAVLGEFNKNASDPVRKLFEVLRNTTYNSHTYKHTTMGFQEDVENMPNLYDYSLEFFRRYYRPEYTTIIVSGDVKHEPVLAMARKYWSEWQKGSYVPQIPVEGRQERELAANVDWPTRTLPLVAVAYKSPAYSDERKDLAAMDLIASLGFSSNSEIYQRLVIKEQTVDALFYSVEEHVDPYLMTVIARVKNQKDVDHVRGVILKTFDSFKTTKVEAERLESVKSHSDTVSR